MQNLVLDDAVLPSRRREYRGKIRNAFFELGKYLFEFPHFQMGEGFEAHIHDCLRLVVREVEAFAQREFRLGRGLGGLDYLYHLVDVAYGDEQPAHDFGTLFRRFEVERRAAHDYVALIGDVIGQYGFEPHLLRLAARYRHHIDGIAEFEIGLFEQE